MAEPLDPPDAAADALAERSAGRRRRARVGVGAAVLVVAALVAAALAATAGDDDVATAPSSTTTTSAAPTTTSRRSVPASTTTGPGVSASSSTTSPATSTSTTAAAPTTAATAAPTTATTAPPPPPAHRSVDPFRGLGAWVDVLDWSPTYTSGAARMDPAEIDVLADRGVQTLYIQTSRFNRPEDVLDRTLLRSLIDRAKARGMQVVGWYLPTFLDEATDLRRLEAIAGLGVHAIGVDIEDRQLADVAERNRRLLRLSDALRQRTTLPIAAIVLPPVVTEVINTAYWPDFPWAGLVPFYDAWLPMAYWTNRTPESGWHDGYRYTLENIDLLRQLTGVGDLPVHAIGGIADAVTPADVDAMAWAVAERDILGGSLYDVRTTADTLWPALQALRR